MASVFDLWSLARLQEVILSGEMAGPDVPAGQKPVASAGRMWDLRLAQLEANRAASTLIWVPPKMAAGRLEVTRHMCISHAE